MKNTDLFDDDEPKKVHLPHQRVKRNKKPFIIGIILVLGSIFVGVVLLPYFIDNEMIPVPIDMSDEEILVEKTNEEIEFTETSVQPSEEKPPDIVKHDFIGSKERLILTRDNEPIFWYIVSTEGQWQGDFSDKVKIPTVIIKEGYLEFQFNCFEEDGKMKYFGDFRNLEGKPISVAVLKAKEILEEKSVDINKAVIMEGFC